MEATQRKRIVVTRQRASTTPLNYTLATVSNNSNSNNNNSNVDNDVATTAVSVLQDTISRLRAELEAEHSNVKQLRREKSHALLAEQHKASLAQKELRYKLHQEKVQELRQQKEVLQAKFDVDAQKAARQRQTEAARTKADLKRCQDELREAAEIIASSSSSSSSSMLKSAISAESTSSSQLCQVMSITKRGLSTMAGGATNPSCNSVLGASLAARDSFEAERAKLGREIQELRSAKSGLEAKVQKYVEGEQRTGQEMRNLVEGHRAEIARARKEADLEVKKLLDVIKAKDRLLSHTDRRTALQGPSGVGALKTASSLSSSGLDSRSMSSDSSRAGSDCGSREGSEDIAAGHRGTQPSCAAFAAPKERPTVLERQNIEINSRDPSHLSHRSISSDVADRSLPGRVDAVQLHMANSSQERALLMHRIQELEKKQKELHEKNKKFLAKNVELTKQKRTLEDKMKGLVAENSELKLETEASRTEVVELRKALESAKEDTEYMEQLQADTEELRQANEDQEGVIEALKSACAEKDRRIELVAHRKRKERKSRLQQKVVKFRLPDEKKTMIAGVTETYYGYAEEEMEVGNSSSQELQNSNSLCSQLSMDFSAEDDVFECSRDELERNYQRLSREKLQLDRSFVSLLGKGGHRLPGDCSHSDSQINWQLEEDLFTAQCRIEELERSLQARGPAEENEKQLSILTEQLDTLREHAENLEFRNLELETQIEKLKQNELQMIESTELLSDVREQLEVAEFRNLELQELVDKNSCRTMGDGCNDTDLPLMTPPAQLEFVMTSAANKDVVQYQQTFGSSESAWGLTDVEDMQEKLLRAEQRIQELEGEAEGRKKKAIVLEYTNEFNQKTEECYKLEVAAPQRELNSSVGGRTYQCELIREKLDQLKESDLRILTLENKNHQLQATFEKLRLHDKELEATIKLREETENGIREKISILEQAEEKLIEQLKEAEERAERTSTEVREPYESRERCIHCEKNIVKADDLVTSPSLDSTIGNQQEEVVRLRDQMEMILNGEVKLTEKLQESEEIIVTLRAEVGESHEVISRYEAEVASLTNLIDEMRLTASSLTKELADSKQEEQCSKEKVLSLVTTFSQFEEKEREWKDERNSMIAVETKTKKHLQELENADALSRNRMKHMGERNAQILTSLRSIHCHLLEHITVKLFFANQRDLNSARDASFVDGDYLEEVIGEKVASTFTGRSEASKVEEFLKVKIEELDENLNFFRAATEEVISALENDAALPVFGKCTPRLQGERQDLTRNPTEQESDNSMQVAPLAQEQMTRNENKVNSDGLTKIHQQIHHIRNQRTGLDDSSDEDSSWHRFIITSSTPNLEHSTQISSTKENKFSIDEFFLKTNRAVEEIVQVASVNRIEKALHGQKRLWGGLYDNSRVGNNSAMVFESVEPESAEALHKQRIREMERMERYLQQQILNLEADRDELRDTIRRDKAVIKESSLTIRELQLSEKYLRGQLSQCETREQQIQRTADELADRKEELEALSKRLQLSECQLRAQLHNYQQSETLLALQLENVKAELESNDLKLKKKKVPTATLR